MVRTAFASVTENWVESVKTYIDKKWFVSKDNILFSSFVRCEKIKREPFIVGVTWKFVSDCRRTDCSNMEVSVNPNVAGPSESGS